MKTTRRLERGYEHLAARERFRLLIAAEARADEAEVERLLRSCPRRLFELADPAVTDRIECSQRVTVAVVSALHAIVSKLAVLDAVEHAARIRFTAAAEEADYETFRLTDATQPTVRRAVRREGGRLRGMLRRLRRELLAEGATVAHAFAAFCRDDLEVEPRAMVAAVLADCDGLLEQFICELPDPDALAATRSLLSDAWRPGTGAGPKQSEPEDGA